ncbi:MAG: cytochrome P450 family protein [Pseudonocardiaceae bacterium]
MQTLATDSELGRHLLTIRGFHFIFGAQRDPYALLLRAESDDPHDLGRQIRDRGELYRSEAGAWVTAGHEMATRLLRDSRLGLRHKGVQGVQQHVFQDVWDNPKLCHIVPLDAAFLNLEQEEYARLRLLSAPLLGTPGVDRYRRDVEDVFQRLTDGLDGEFDLMTEVARKAAIAVVTELTDLPAQERDRFAQLCIGLDVALDAGLCPPQLKTARRLLESIDQVRELFTGVIAERHGEDRDDLISSLLRERGDDERATDDVLAICMLITVAGIEVTANLLCNALAELLDHPEQWELLRQDRGLAPSAVRETLRYAPPVRLENLIAHEDLELLGQQVPADSQVVLFLAAANRDLDVYPDPDRFDITRTANGNLSLSDDLPTGLIAPLAQLQAAVALQVVAERLPRIRRADEMLRRMRSPVARGVLRFPATTA